MLVTMLIPLICPLRHLRVALSCRYSRGKMINKQRLMWSFSNQGNHTGAFTIKPQVAILEHFFSISMRP